MSSTTRFKRYTTAITQFSGVDYSSQRFNVSSNRAIDILNYIYKDGVIQKRLGCRQIALLDPLDMPYAVESAPSTVKYNGWQKNSVWHTRVNGIWRFKAEDGNEHIIAHIYKLLCEITITDGMVATATPIARYTASSGNKICYEFEDYRSSAFIGGNKMYFLGGNMFVVLRFTSNGSEIYEVEDNENTFIPTTTIAISPQNSGVGGQSSYDKINLMTQWHKNTLLTGAEPDETLSSNDKSYNFVLDQPLICKSASKDEMDDFKIILKERGFYVW